MAKSDHETAAHDVVHVAIICMISGLELRAIVETLEDAGARRIPTDVGQGFGEYFLVEVRQSFHLRVMVSCCEHQSNLEVAIRTSEILYRFNPRFSFLCGIAGGLRVDKIPLGDVVADAEVIYRRYSKIGETGEFLPEAVNVPTSSGGKALLTRFFANHRHPHRIQSPLNDGATFGVYTTPEKILSWDYVLDHQPTKEALLKNLDRQLAVVETEGAGFLKAVDSYNRNTIRKPWHTGGGADAIIVRGISDPAAGKTASDAGAINWRRTAARNAAQTVLLLIRQLEEYDLA